jgi:hypothetical protein
LIPAFTQAGGCFEIAWIAQGNRAVTNQDRNIRWWNSELIKNSLPFRIRPQHRDRCEVGVKAPVDEHTEASFAPPLHPDIALCRALGRPEWSGPICPCSRTPWIGRPRLSQMDSWTGLLEMNRIYERGSRYVMTATMDGGAVGLGLQN